MLSIQTSLKARFNVAPVASVTSRGYRDYTCKELRGLRISWKTVKLADYEAKLEIRNPEKRGGVAYIPKWDACVYGKHLSSIPALNWARATAHGSASHDAYKAYLKVDAVIFSTNQSKKPSYRKRLAASLTLCLKRLEWIYYNTEGGPVPAF